MLFRSLENPEPRLAGYIPPFPAIESPGRMEGFAGAGPQTQAKLAKHQQDAEQFKAEASAHKALKKLLACIAPKPLHSGKAGSDEGDIGLHSLRELLGHLEPKCSKALAARECGKIWEIFNPPMAGLSPEQYFARQLACQKKLKRAAVPITDAQIKIKAIVHFNQIAWMQAHAAEWEAEEDPDNTRPLAECRAHFIKRAGRH